MISDLYPLDWRELAYLIKDANAWQCQACGVQCRRPGEFPLGWEYELTIAHYHSDYESEAIFLACLCRRCHFLHDAPLVWSARRRADRWRQRQAGQLALLAY